MQVERSGRAAGALPLLPGSGDQHHRPVEALDEPRGDDADHTLVPALVGEHVAAPGALRLGPLVDLRERLAQDSALDALALAVQLLELVRELAGLVGVVGEQQLERRARPAEAARCVDARREPEADRALVDPRPGRRARPSSARAAPASASARGRAGPRARAPGSRPRAGRRRRSSRARRGRGGARAPRCPGRAAPRRACRRLRCRRARGTGSPRAGGDDGAVRQRLARPVVVRDDDVEPLRAGLRDFLDGGDPAVDGQHEPAALVGEPRERLALHPVALLEAARQVPFDVGAELRRISTASAVAQIPSAS